MVITPIIPDIQLGLSHSSRGTGLHMSDIYNDLFKALDPKRYTDTPPDPARLEAGLALEEALERALLARLIAERPGELTTAEGIVYSPDLIIFGETMRLGEIKLTWLSSREVPREAATSFPPQFQKYFVQMMAYCHAIETPHARLYAYFVNGNYRPSRPEFLAWDMTFSARELQENWRMLITHARGRGMLS